MAAQSDIPSLRGPRTARSTLLHLLGDLVHPSREAVPTSAFIAVLETAGHETASARQALLRAARSGWISGDRRGRETWWSLTEHGHALIADGHRRMAALGREDHDWDGRWVIVVTSIPHSRRAVRERVYRYLSWSGFGMPMPGLWISPHTENERGARYAISQFDLTDTSASFIGGSGTVGVTDAELVARAWNITDVEAHYCHLLERHVSDSSIGADAAMRALLELDVDLRALPLVDPQLPKELVPDRSSRAAARQLLELRDSLVHKARPYWEALSSDN